jgi:hypothetical protein
VTGPLSGDPPAGAGSGGPPAGAGSGGPPAEPVPGGPGGAPGTGRPSGLRNPAAAVRGLGAGTLVMEAVVLLLALQPIRILGGRLSGAAIAAVVVLAVVAVALAGMMRRAWVWPAATVLQVLVLLSGFLHWSLAVLGLIFGAVWAYVLHVRRTILG